MPRRSRAHFLPVSGIADGDSGSRTFNLNAGSRLKHVSIAVASVGTAPLRCVAALIQPRADNNIFSYLTGGWIRGASSNPASSHDLSWDGDLEIDTDMALRITGRNDTGAEAAFLVNIVVVE